MPGGIYWRFFGIWLHKYVGDLRSNVSVCYKMLCILSMCFDVHILVVMVYDYGISFGTWLRHIMNDMEYV
jgi:hypothetical protein